MKLNLGSGAKPLKGWENIDLPDVDLREFPWKWKNNSITEIQASHILEHFDRVDGAQFLDECYRILKPGGVLHIAVPDMNKFIDCLNNGDWSPIGHYPWTDLNWFMGGDSIREQNVDMRHRYMYCFASLAYTLERIGFENVTKRGLSDIDNHEYQLISLYVDAYKPDPGHSG